MARRVLEALLKQSYGEPELQPLKKCTSLEQTKEVSFHGSNKGVYSLQYNYNGTVLAVGFGSGGIQLFDPKTGSLIKELRPCRQGGDPVMVMRFHPKEPYILYAATTEGHIYIYNCDSGELVQTIEEIGNEINSLDFCVDGYNFATGGRDLGIRIYETKTNKLFRTYEGAKGKRDAETKDQIGNTMRVFSIKYHPDNEYIFISGGWDNHIKIWDARANDGIKRNITGPHICGDSLDMKGNTILAGQWTALHSLQEYDYTDGKCHREIKFPHTDGAFLYCAAYVSDDLVIAGGSGTKSAEVIEISTDRHIGGFKSQCPIQAIDTANEGRTIAVGGSDSKFNLFTLKA